MKLSMPISAFFALLLGTGIAAAADTQTGLQNLAIPDTQGDRHIKGFVWYPTDSQDASIMAHGNAVWEAIRVIPDAAPVEGKKPLLVMSHGMFGNARNQAWLAAAMTAKGYVVAAIDHPGTTTFNKDPDHRRELWRRPGDISRTIDHLLADPALSTLIDRERIFMAGHSLGGFTAIALAGGRYDSAKVDADCAETPDELICGLIDDWGVVKSPEGRAAMSGDLSDDRIAGFAVFDLGGTQTFSPESLAAIQRPLFVIGAPTGPEALDLDRESRALVAALPPELVKYSEPPSLGHFDFLGVCTDRGIAVLKQEEPEDAFICENGTDARRAKHDQIANDVIAFFAGL